MKTNKMYAVVKEPGKAAEIRLVDSNHRSFNAVICGKRQLVPLSSDKGLCVIFNGEASPERKANIYIPEYEDIVFGTVIIARLDADTGFLSLTEEQADRMIQYLKVNDARGFNGNPEESCKRDYLPKNEENSLFEYLSEIKDKYKTVKIGWLNKR